MDKLVKSRKALRTSYVRLCSSIYKLLDEGNLDLDEIKAKYMAIEGKYLDISHIDKQVYELLLEDGETDDEALDRELELCSEYESKYLLLKVKVDGLSCKAQSVTESNSGSKSVCKGVYRLPKLEIKKFSGDVKEWLQFWAQFKKVHEDPDMETSDKFQYLLQYTVPGSRARQLVESFPPSEENYEKAINSLKSRFGRDDFLIEVYVRELLKLVLNNIQSTSDVCLARLHDQLEGNLLSLDSLGVTTDKCAAMLFPLVESCLPEPILRVWQRNLLSDSNCSLAIDSKKRLENLMAFIRSEVENEERITLAMSGFKIGPEPSVRVVTKTKSTYKQELPTAAALLVKNDNIGECMFCREVHNSDQCTKAEEMDFEEKKQILFSERVCFLCFRHGHSARGCNSVIRCKRCKGRHQTVMCYRDVERISLKDNALANFSNNEQIFLQTLLVRVRGKDVSRTARAIIDTGSQKSYILKNTAIEMGYEPQSEKHIVHSLFGGTDTGLQTHKAYKVYLSNIEDSYRCNFDVLDQKVICNKLKPVGNGVWMKELSNLDIKIRDTWKSSEPIEILIGADVAGKLFTGQIRKLRCGLVAMETLLGWTLMGKTLETGRSRTDSLINMMVTEPKASGLCSLDVWGIRDPLKLRIIEEVVEQRETKKKRRRKNQRRKKNKSREYHKWKTNVNSV